jgi:acetyl esterase/lipase
MISCKSSLPNFQKKPRIAFASLLLIFVLFVLVSIPGACAQEYVARGLTIELEDGIKTDAQLTLPKSGTSPFPGILLLQGENDTQIPLQEAMLLEQKLKEVNHPDHTLIIYPGLGHSFHPSKNWIQPLGPMEEVVLEDLYAWLTSPNRRIREGAG